MHVYSNASDGKMMPEEIIYRAKDEGIEVITLTDYHNEKNIDKKNRKRKWYISCCYRLRRGYCCKSLLNS